LEFSFGELFQQGTSSIFSNLPQTPLLIITRILALENKTGKEVIVTTCGFEDEQKLLEGEFKSLPEGVKVCYRLENGIFSPEESDWLAGDSFKFLRVTQVEEYEQE
jgi:hypothetical protein